MATSTKTTAAERASFEDAKNRLIESLKGAPKKPAKRAASSGVKTKPTAAAKSITKRDASR